jgi:predicted MFS family arabinose efflux permease
MMSVAAGVAVANTYYSQSIIKELAVFFAVSESQAGIIPALSVAGYGMGLFFLTPQGDRVDRKKLIHVKQCLLMIVLAGMSSATHYWLMGLMSFLTGFLSITAQLLIPMAAALDAEARSKNIGIIVTGLLTGMLGARAVSGYITTLAGWQYVYGFSAFLILTTSILLYFTLPSVGRRFEGNYIELLRSALWQIRRFPQLRTRTLLGSLIFALFCSFWTTLTLHLGGAPFNFRADTIGLFSFIGITGAATTLVFGKIIRPDNIDRLRMLTVSLLTASALLLLLFPFSIYALITTVVLLDMGVQATQLTNLSTIYQLDEKAHSRINTIYMTTCFAGGGLGTLAGLACWKLGGWNLVVWQLLMLSLATVAVASFISAKERPGLPVAVSQKVN